MSATGRLEAGTFVRDDHGDSDTLFLVVETTNTPADQYYVPALDRTVAEWPPNQDYPDDDRVVRAVPTPNLADHFGDLWHVDDVLAAVADGNLTDLTDVYSYPASRLTPVE